MEITKTQLEKIVQYLRLRPYGEVVDIALPLEILIAKSHDEPIEPSKNGLQEKEK